jgi:hypothetical protein
MYVSAVPVLSRRSALRLIASTAGMTIVAACGGTPPGGLADVTTVPTGRHSGVRGCQTGRPTEERGHAARSPDG